MANFLLQGSHLFNGIFPITKPTFRTVSMYTAIFKKPSSSSQDQSIKPRSGRTSELRIILLLSIYYPNRRTTYHLGSLNIPIPIVLYKTLLVIHRYKSKGYAHAS